jgi:large subunit ribosomal protein L4
MATVPVHSPKGKKKGGSLELDPAVFEAPIRPHLFHAEVRRQLARRRSGTHSTKNRSAVAGGGAKPWRQKGTGRARQGSTRSPQWAGGGAVFGPVPRSYEHKLTKKARMAALRGALSQKLGEEALLVVEDIQLEGFGTRAVVEILDGLGVAGESVLLVIGDADEKIEVSARNLPQVSVIRAEGLNVYDVLRHARLVLTRGAVEKVAARLAPARKEAQA